MADRIEMEVVFGRLSDGRFQICAPGALPAGRMLADPSRLVLSGRGCMLSSILGQPMSKDEVLHWMTSFYEQGGRIGSG